MWGAEGVNGLILRNLFLYSEIGMVVSIVIWCYNFVTEE
jgi:hypothetical protein